MIYTQLNESIVLETLKQVMDPEIGCNIVVLGLIYDVGISGGRVQLTMTHTTPGCPMHESLVAGVRQAILTIPGVTDAVVEVVWDPRWQPSMINAAGRAAGGVPQL